MSTTFGARASVETGTHERDHTEAEAAIRATIKAVEAGWNAGSGDAFAAPFADDADYVIVNGQYVKSRAAIAAGHQQIFDTIYRGSHNHATIRNVRWLREDVAVAHVEWRLRFQQDGTPREAAAMNTMILTQDDGVWHIAAFQNTPLQGQGMGERG